MSQFYVVPEIYEDISNQSQGYFAFRFRCNLCQWSIESMPIRSSVSTVTNVMDIGVGLLGGFWGRAAQAGEQVYGSKWHSEQANALQKAWGEVQHEFHLCPRCHTTVCMRCFNVKLNLCTRCAPDLKADGAQHMHELNVEAQRGQIEQNYRAPQFDTGNIPSAVTPDMLAQPPQQSMPSPQQGWRIPEAPPVGQNQVAVPRSSAGSGALVSPQLVACPTCRRMGPTGKFCQDCGTKLPTPDVICPNCSSAVEPTSRFCPECGTKLQMAT